jgi:D-xylose transport system permease protein
VVWAICVGLYAAVQLVRLRNRTKAGLAVDPVVIVGLRIAGLAVALGLVVLIANEDRGVPYVGLLVGALLVFWTYVLNRTRFGRHVYAVGGNAEGARRAGINVDNVRIACFAIVSVMAVLGGIILASRLRSVDTNTGGGQALLYPIAAAVIGGTSLFGGRGTMKAALLGAIVMIGIDNGLGLLGLSSGTKFVVTGGVLLLAVTVDSISRRGRASSGRA